MDVERNRQAVSIGNTAMAGHLGWARSLAVFIALVALGCSSSGPPAGGDPDEVVESAYAAIMAGDYDAFTEHTTAEARREMSALLPRFGGEEGVMAVWTGGGTLERVETDLRFATGAGAEVITVKHYEDGSQEVVEVVLVREDGEWRLAWGDYDL